MKNKILITGVAGLLGSRLADWILDNKRDYSIIGIDDLSGGFKENIDKRIEFYKLNLVVDDLEKIFKDGSVKYVFHFAAYAAEGLSPFIRSYNYQNNLVATSRIVNMCIKYSIERLVFTSTLAVYGHGYGGKFEESQIPKPIDPYGVAKYACEMDIKIANKQHGLDYCIIRPHNVYGIKQNIWDKYRNVLGIWMFQVLNNQNMSIFGDGEQTRAFSYIDDSLEPLWNSAVRKIASKQIINLGGIDSTSILEASKVLRDVIGYGKVEHFEQRHEVKHSIPTFQKSIDLLSFNHKTNLKEGLEIMWEWAKKQPKRQRYVWSNYELDNGIYNYWKNNK